MTNVSLNIQTRECVPDNLFLGYEGENEVNKLIFKFTDGFFDGAGLLNVKRGEQKGYVTLEKVGETYELDVKNSLLSQKGDIIFQLAITSTTGAVIKFNPFAMTVKDSIDTESELPEEYPSWIDEANAKLAEIDKAIKNAEETTAEIIQAKENGEFNGEDGEDGYSPSAKVTQTKYGAKIEITDAEGTTTAIIQHGSGSGSGGGDTTIDLSGYATKKELNEKVDKVEGKSLIDDTEIQRLANVDNYDDTEIKEELNNINHEINNKANKTDIPTKTSELNNDSGFATETYVEEEIAKFDFIKVVDVLPETGLPNRIYFVPKSDTETQDLFDEFAWINDAWEYITTKQIEIDMSKYATIEYVDGLVGNIETLLSEV